MSECPHCHCDPVREFHSINCKTYDFLRKAAAKQAAKKASPVRASRIGGEYDPDGSDPVLVVRDEHGVLRAFDTYTKANGAFVRGNLKGYGDVIILEPEDV